MRLEESCEVWLSKSGPSRDLGQKEPQSTAEDKPSENCFWPYLMIVPDVVATEADRDLRQSLYLLQSSLYEQYPHQAAFLPPGLNSHSGTFWFVSLLAL